MVSFPSPGSVIPHPHQDWPWKVVFAFSQVMGEGSDRGPGGPKPFPDFSA